MKNGDENIYPFNKNIYVCSICNLSKAPINISKIRNNKLKNILSKLDKDDLISKCKCLDEESTVHTICLLLNIIYNFEVKCRHCKSYYNIIVDKSLNDSKKLGKIFSYLCFTLIHVILISVSVILIIYIFVLKKESKDNFEYLKYEHIYIFFGVVIFIINILLMTISYVNFIDKNETDVYDYTIKVKDEKGENKMNTNFENSCYLLNNFYRYFHNTRTKYLIKQCHKGVFFDSGYANFNKEIRRMIKENNKDNNNDDNVDISNINIEPKNKQIELKNFHYTGTLGIQQDKSNNIENSSFEKNSKNTNPINLQLSLIKKENEDNINNKDNMDDILIINKNLSNKKEKSERHKHIETTIYSNKKFNIISKSFFYKKISPTKIFTKSRTYKTKSDRKKENGQNKNNFDIKQSSKKFIKLDDSNSNKKYADSTSLLKSEKEKEKNQNA